MCKHTHSTVVTGGKLAIHQCDMCGAMLWWKDVDDSLPALIDVTALEMWERRTAEHVARWTWALDDLLATDPGAERRLLREWASKGGDNGNYAG